MTDQRELDRMLGAFLGEGADELADRVIDAALDEIDHTQQRRVVRLPRRFPTMNTYSRLGAAAVIGVLAVAGTLVLVQRGQPGVGGSGPTPIPSASPSQPASPSPSPVVGVVDEALLADLAAVASNPYDAAKVAALYAPNAVLYDKVANETSTGLEAIQAKDKATAAVGFEVKITSAWIRQDNFVAHFAKFGNTSELSGRGLVVYELKDGKVLNQWVYDAASSAATQSPAAVTDEALVADLAAVWSNPYDAAKVAALYAPNAVLYDKNANETSTGLEAIQAKVEAYAAKNFKVKITSDWIRQDNFVAHFANFGNTSELSGRGLVVYELMDGKVLNQWVYPAS
jgi:hypothetical protein